MRGLQWRQVGQLVILSLSLCLSKRYHLRGKLSAVVAGASSASQNIFVASELGKVAGNNTNEEDDKDIIGEIITSGDEP